MVKKVVRKRELEKLGTIKNAIEKHIEKTEDCFSEEVHWARGCLKDPETYSGPEGARRLIEDIKCAEEQIWESNLGTIKMDTGPLRSDSKFFERTDRLKKELVARLVESGEDVSGISLEFDKTWFPREDE